MTQFNLPFTGVQINEAIEKARVHVVGLDTAPQQGSNKVVNSDGIYTAVNAKINTSDIVTEAQTIAANDVDTKVPSVAAVKDYVDTQTASAGRNLASGWTTLSSNQSSASGTAPSDGFLIFSYRANDNETDGEATIVVEGVTFNSRNEAYANELVTMPIASGGSWSVTFQSTSTQRVYFKALS